MPDNLTGFPQYADWLAKYCSGSEHAFVRDSARMISYCFELERQLPERYGWRFCDEEALKKQIHSARSSQEFNRIYWMDQARNVEAYAAMTFWRGTELLKPAIRGLNLHEVLASAVLARSCLELAATFLVNANMVEKTFKKLRFADNAVVVSHEFEERVVKMIWGTRLGDPASHLKQANVLTTIQKLSRHPHVRELLPTYEYLCEVAHPNVIGNIRFWSHVERTHPDGSETRVLEKHAGHERAQEIIAKVVWSLAWSAVCLRNGVELTREGLAELLGRLGVPAGDKGHA